MYPVSASILLKFSFAGDQVGLGVFLIAQFVLSRRSRLGKLPLFIQGGVKDGLYLLPESGIVLQLCFIDPLIRLIPVLSNQRIVKWPGGKYKLVSPFRKVKKEAGGFHGLNDDLLSV